MEAKIMKERIAIDPNIHFGKPCIAGTRIPVQSVLELVRDGIPFDRIIQDYYPDLRMEDIRASIQYAIDVVTAEEIHIAAVGT
jgi:uncharacterized protein (DUF433 family)